MDSDGYVFGALDGAPDEGDVLLPVGKALERDDPESSVAGGKVGGGDRADRRFGSGGGPGLGLSWRGVEGEFAVKARGGRVGGAHEYHYTSGSDIL